MAQHLGYAGLHRLSLLTKNHLHRKRHLERFVPCAREVSVVTIANLSTELVRTVGLTAHHGFQQSLQRNYLYHY